ncbi:DUF4386 domain-containing protein [Paenibacillus illinoisensis]|uniref:DUF4386 domain-containing protein n=1 Tax=Paenibacillus illinoisensis TaxID=59845 RepID=UPI001C8EE1DC|nr:DUF4386 domain-containing protein [Paenibacillus illinoisensis]MBY0217849.1 DUF4386 domain-containing protein [Paenibacillus illinoisensis]
MNQWIARITGLLFLVSTCAYLLGSGLLNPILEEPDILEGVYLDQTNIAFGLFLELINAIAVVGIAMLLFPVLRKHNEAFTLGYFASRVIESAMLIISLIFPLLLIMLSGDYRETEATDRLFFQTLAKVAVESHFKLFELAMIVLSIGSLLFCYVLYQSKFVPRILSIIGFVGYLGLLTSSCLSIAGVDLGAILYIPGAIFEIVLPIWLLVKGYNR